MKTYPAGKLPPAELGRLLAAYTHRHERLLVPPAVGEDAAVIDCGDRLLVAKTDPITFASDEIGWYAVHVNANDIAAMGATPRFFLSTILLPEERATPELAASIFRSIHQAAESLGVAVCGGHTEVTYGIDRPLVIGQMLGETTRDRLVRSSGLQPGHALLLTKGLGIEATAIIAREKRAQLRDRGCTLPFWTPAPTSSTRPASASCATPKSPSKQDESLPCTIRPKAGSPRACGNWPPHPLWALKSTTTRCPSIRPQRTSARPLNSIPSA